MQSSPASERDWRKGRSRGDRSWGGRTQVWGWPARGLPVPGRPVTGVEAGTVLGVCRELLPTGSGVSGGSGLGLGECETPAGQVPGGEAPGAGGPAARAWSAAAGSRSRGAGTARERREEARGPRPARPGAHLQHHLYVVRVPLALLVAAELGAAVEQAGGHAGLLGVDGRRRDERGRAGGRGTGRRGTLGADRHRGVPRSQGWGEGERNRRRRAGAEGGWQGGRGRGAHARGGGGGGTTRPLPADQALRLPPGPRDLRAGPPCPELSPPPHLPSHTHHPFDWLRRAGGAGTGSRGAPTHWRAEKTRGGVREGPSGTCSLLPEARRGGGGARCVCDAD